ncbi:MAG: amidohydrolase family protein, partial [Pyrinomonadaceae bacterium]
MPIFKMISIVRLASAIAILSTLIIAAAAPLPSGFSASSNPDQLDLLIVHGKLVDGSGKKARTADIGIRGDRIVFVGDARKSNQTAARTIDATGLIVAPGFIDSHTHTLADLNDDQRKGNEAFLLQGVTTVITGNDGNSAQNIDATLRRWDAQGI